MSKKRIFVDMDGVLVNFDAKAEQLGLKGDELKIMKGAYLDLEPMPGALEGVKALIGMGFDVWLATKPPTGIPWAYADKVQWVLDHIPELSRKILILHDKSLLIGDYIIDDRVHKANVSKFQGVVLKFGAGYYNWEELRELFRFIKKESEWGTA